MTFVVAGGIVRNRAWVLPRHIDAVLLNNPAKCFYVTGDNNDATYMTLYNRGIEGVRVMEHDTGEPGWTRDGKDGPRYRSAHMAAERNLWASEALKRWPQATHLWVVDSDVLPEPDVLEKLLALKAPVAAAFVPLADGVTPIAMAGWDAELGRAKRTGEESKLTKPHVATMIGGCYLIETCLFKSRNVLFWKETPTDYPGLVLLSTGVRRVFGPLWGEHPQGEDGYFAWFMRCNSLFPMLHHPGARCRHIMERGGGIGSPDAR